MARLVSGNLSDRVFEGNMGAPDDSWEEVCERQHKEIEQLRTRLQEDEAERNRLAAELLASQAREAERGMLLGRIFHEAEAEDGGRRVLTKATLEAIRSALARPSPAAQAIGRVLEQAEVSIRYGRLTRELGTAVRTLQALHSGQPSPVEESA